MTNAGGYENADVLFGQVFMKFAAVNQDIHGVSHAETVPKVMKRVVSVVFLHTELEPNFINGFTFLEIAMEGFRRGHTSQIVVHNSPIHDESQTQYIWALTLP